MPKFMTYMLLPLTFCFLLVSTSQAQWIIKTEQFEVPPPIAKKATAKYGSVSKTPTAAFAALAKAAGQELAADQTTIYVRANGDYAAESNALQGKTKFVYDNKTESFSIVQYDEKKVMTGTRKDIKKTTEQAATAMSDIEKRMAEAMKNANLTEEQKKAASRYLPGFKNQAQEEAKVEDTGDTAKLLDRLVRRFVIRKSDEVTTVWAANDDRRLAQTARDIQSNMKSMVKMGREEKDELEHLPAGYYPLDIITEQSGMGRRDVRINRTTEITPGDPGTKPFYVPGPKEGFEVVTLQDAMRGMMQGADQFRRKR